MTIDMAIPRLYASRLRSIVPTMNSPTERLLLESRVEGYDDIVGRKA